jgi:hypothetical protein
MRAWLDSHGLDLANLRIGLEGECQGQCALHAIEECGAIHIYIEVHVYGTRNTMAALPST